MSELDKLIHYYAGLLPKSRGLLTRQEIARIKLTIHYLEEFKKVKGE